MELSAKSFTADATLAEPRASVEGSPITMTVNEIRAFVTKTIFDAIGGHDEVTSKVENELMNAIELAIKSLFYGKPVSTKTFSDSDALDAFAASAIASVSKSITNTGVSKLHSALKRLEVAAKITGKRPEQSLELLKISDLRSLAIKAYHTGRPQLEAQLKFELLMRPELSPDEIILNLMHSISANERIPDIERAIGLSEILLEYLETKVADAQVTLKSSRRNLIERTMYRLENLKSRLSATILKS